MTFQELVLYIIVSWTHHEAENPHLHYPEPPRALDGGANLVWSAASASGRA